MEEYITITQNETTEITEKKSKFIADLYYVENAEQVEEKIIEIKKKYYDARHHCIAYRYVQGNQVIEKSSDDGEPSGTAGAPMLNILQKNNLCNILVIVTRYFGGILLGTGGLVRAYSEATQKAIEQSKLVTKIKGIEAEVKLDYSNLESFKYFCRNNNVKIVNVEYLEDVVLKIEMENNVKNIILNKIETKTLNIKKIEVLREKFINKTVEKNK